MKVYLCGVRGSIPAPGGDFLRYGGHTSCIALAHDDSPANTPTLLLDAGTGLQSVSAVLGDKPFDGTILLTHLHWDHVIGLPFFPASDHSDAHVRVLLPEQESGEEASRVLAGMMSPPYFPIEPTELRGEWSFAAIAPGEHEIEGFTVLAREIPHKGGRTFGYRCSDGHSTLVYMPDHCPTMLGHGGEGFGEYHPAAIELAKDADMLIHDAQLLPAEMEAEAAFGHAVADYAVGLARRAGARSVSLFHHRHNRSDDALDALARRLGGGTGSPTVSVAAEGSAREL